VLLTEVCTKTCTNFSVGILGAHKGLEWPSSRRLVALAVDSGYTRMAGTCESNNAQAFAEVHAMRNSPFCSAAGAIANTNSQTPLLDVQKLFELG
jgi:hypothetical protein